MIIYTQAPPADEEVRARAPPAQLPPDTRDGPAGGPLQGLAYNIMIIIIMIIIIIIMILIIMIIIMMIIIIINTKRKRT